MAMGKNPPKTETKPYISMIIPMIGQPRSRMMTPPKKHTLPFNLSACKKKLEDFWNPITNTSPINIENKYLIHIFMTTLPTYYTK